MRHYAIVCMWPPWMLPHMTTFWLRSPLWHLRFARDNAKRLHLVSECCWSRLSCYLSVFRLLTSRTFNLAVPYFLSLSWKLVATSPSPGRFNLSSFICFGWNLSMHYSTVLDTVPTPQPDLSPSLSLPYWVSSWSSSSQISTSSECPRLLRQYLIAIIFSSNIFSGFLVITPSYWAFLISTCYCLIAVSTFSTCFLATVVSLSVESWINFYLSLLLRFCIFPLFSTASMYLDCKQCNPVKAQNVSASKPRMPLFP